MLRRNVALSRFPKLDRTMYAFFAHDVTPEACAANDEFYRAVTSGTPEEKKEALAKKIEEFGRIDLTSVDLGDDAACVREFAKLSKISLIADSQNIIRVAKENGIDLSEPRFAGYCEKAEVLNSMMDCIALKTRVLSDPAYSYVDLEKISGADFDTLSENPEAYGAFSMSCTELGSYKNNGNEYTKKLLDYSVPMKKKISGLIADARNNSPEYTASKAVNPYTDTPDGFFAKQLEKQRNSLAKEDDRGFAVNHREKFMIAAIYRVQREYSEVVGKGVILSHDDFRFRFGPDVIKAEADRIAHIPFVSEVLPTIDDARESLASGDMNAVRRLDDAFALFEKKEDAARENDPHAYYKNKILANIAKIKAVDDTFSMTDAEIEAMITPERLSRRGTALNVVSDERKIIAASDIRRDGTMPDGFKRLVGTLGEPLSRPGAENRNNIFFRKLTQQDAQGMELRRQTAANMFERLNVLSADDIKGKDEQAFFDYAAANYAAGKIGYAFKDISENITGDNVVISEPAKRQIRENEQYFTNLGNAIVNKVSEYADDDKFTFPMHKLTQQQAMLLAADPSTAHITAKYLQQNRSKQVLDEMLASDKRSTLNISQADFTVGPAVLPAGDLGTVKAKFADFRTRLAAADNFYNFNNSSEYTQLLSALKNADEVFSKAGNGHIAEEMKDPVRNALSDVLVKSRAYYDKKSRQEATENRTKRLAICTEIGMVCKGLVGDAADVLKNDDHRFDNDYLSFLRRQEAFANAADRAAMAEKYAVNDAAFVPMSAKDKRDKLEKISGIIEKNVAGKKLSAEEKNDIVENTEKEKQHAYAKKYADYIKDLDKTLKAYLDEMGISELPRFNRIVQYYMDISGAPDADRRNRELISSLLTEDGCKKFACKAAAELLSIDTVGLLPTRDLNVDMPRYGENVRSIELAFVVSDLLNNEKGHDYFSAEVRNALEDRKAVLQGLESFHLEIDLAANDFYSLLPEMDIAESYQLTSSVSNKAAMNKLFGSPDAYKNLSNVLSSNINVLADADNPENDVMENKLKALKEAGELTPWLVAKDAEGKRIPLFAAFKAESRGEKITYEQDENAKASVTQLLDAYKPDAAPANEAPVNEAPANEAPANEAPANDIPGEELPVNAAPAREELSDAMELSFGKKGLTARGKGFNDECARLGRLMDDAKLWYTSGSQEFTDIRELLSMAVSENLGAKGTGRIGLRAERIVSLCDQYIADKRGRELKPREQKRFDAVAEVRRSMTEIYSTLSRSAGNAAVEHSRGLVRREAAAYKGQYDKLSHEQGAIGKLAENILPAVGKLESYVLNGGNMERYMTDDELRTTLAEMTIAQFIIKERAEIQKVHPGAKSPYEKILDKTCENEASWKAFIRRVADGEGIRHRADSFTFISDEHGIVREIGRQTVAEFFTERYFDSLGGMFKNDFLGVGARENDQLQNNDRPVEENVINTDTHPEGEPEELKIDDVL